MSKQIAVTIPDELHERLQAVKGSFNVSGACQQAIERAVTLEEIKAKEIPQMDQLVEKLRLQKQEDAQEWHEIGFKDGKRYAPKLDLTDFRFLNSLLHTDYDVNPPKIRPYVAQDFYNKDIHHYIYGTFHKKDGPDAGNWDAYMEGWIMGAISVWDEVKGEI